MIRGRPVVIRRGLVGALLAVHAALLLHSARVNSVTIDEAAHFAAGVHHWETGTFKLYRVNPPLVTSLAVLPAMAAGIDTKFTPLMLHLAEVARPEGPAGFQLAEANAGRYFDLLFLARLTGVLWSLLAALTIYCWARQLHGSAAGFLALTLWCLDPLVLGHAALLTPDIPAAASAIAATYQFWRYLREPSKKRLALAGILLGVAQLTKFTNLVLFAIWPLIWIVQRRRPLAAPRSLLRSLRAGGAIAGLAIVVMNAGYGCSGTGRPLGKFQFTSAGLRGRPLAPEERDHGRMLYVGSRFEGTVLGSLPAPLPADLMLGVDRQQYDFDRTMRSYLDGEWRTQGWWYYYLYAFALKIPIGFGVLLGWALVRCAARRTGAPITDELAVLAFPLVVFLLTAIKSEFTHHLRYVLPAIPFLFVLGGGLVQGVRVRSWRMTAVAALLAWGAISSLRIHPHSLSYFNELAGGPAHGSAHLVDSNIDWGQDLRFLKRWLDEHPDVHLDGLAYAGPIAPRLAGIAAPLPPAGPAGLLARDPSWSRDRVAPAAGWYAVSINFLRGLRFHGVDGDKIRMIGPGDYEYFSQLEPAARAGYSIAIYHVSEGQARALRAVMGMIVEPAGSARVDAGTPDMAHVEHSIRRAQ